jgi:seryl-tRNA synthetase
MVLLLYNLIKRKLFFQKVVNVSVEKLTLKERVENLEKIAEELTFIIQKGSSKTIQDAEANIQKIIKAELENAKTELWEEKKKIEVELSGEPEVIREILEILEKQLGVNVVLLQKKIK